MAFSGWAITHDYQEAGRIGYGQRRSDADATTESFIRIIGRTVYVIPDLDPKDCRDPRKFRLKDDDGNLCFEGVITAEWLDDEELAFHPLRFAETDVGATQMEYYQQGKGWSVL